MFPNFIKVGAEDGTVRYWSLYSVILNSIEWYWSLKLIQKFIQVINFMQAVTEVYMNGDTKVLRLIFNEVYSDWYWYL